MYKCCTTPAVRLCGHTRARAVTAESFADAASNASLFATIDIYRFRWTNYETFNVTRIIFHFLQQEHMQST